MIRDVGFCTHNLLFLISPIDSLSLSLAADLDYLHQKLAV